MTVAVTAGQSDGLFEDVLAQEASEDLPVRPKLPVDFLFHDSAIITIIGLTI